MASCDGCSYKGFTFNGATGSDPKGAGWYSIPFDGGAAKAGRWYVVVVNSKASAEQGSAQELSERMYFDTDGGDKCGANSGGRQKVFIDFKEN